MDNIDRLAKQDEFIKWLSRKGNVAASCKKARVSRHIVYQWRNKDEHFAQRWDEALEIATEWLEEEARRRAADGVLEPVYYQGERVGSVRKYSDTLLIFLLKAHKPEKYRENYTIEHSGDVTLHADATEQLLGRLAGIASRIGADEPDPGDSAE